MIVLFIKMRIQFSRNFLLDGHIDLEKRRAGYYLVTADNSKFYLGDSDAHLNKINNLRDEARRMGCTVEDFVNVANQYSCAA